MELSIIITTRNRKNDLLSCVNSIKNSDLKSISTWELIIVDDCSNDGTELLVSNDLQLDNCKIIHNTEQQMMVKSRNIGAKNAIGKYLLYIDDDNIIEPNMISILVNFANNHKDYGIIGPVMYRSNKQKCFNYQYISLLTGKTYFYMDNTTCEVCNSDGIPNVFLIYREVFEKCGYFDESIIQSYTEPDLAFTARNFGYKCGIVKNAKTYHNIGGENYTSRSLGGQFSQKAYCLIRNRTVMVARYGKWYQRLIYIVMFSWFWPLIYSMLVLRENRWDLVKLYWLGYLDGIRYFFTGKLKNSLKK